MCIQTITSYACKHISTTYNTTTPHCSTTSICTLPSPLPARNVKSSLPCAKCLAEKLEREANQMRELERFARISGGEVKVAGEKEKEAEGGVKSVRVIAKDLEETGYVAEGLLKMAGKVETGSPHSVVKEKEEAVIEDAEEKGTEKGAMSAEDVEIEGALAEGITSPTGVHSEESITPGQIQSEELDTPPSFKDLSLNEPTQKVDTKQGSTIGKPGSPETNKSTRSMPGPSEQKDLELKNVKAKNHTPEKSKIARSASTRTPKKPLKASTSPKTNDTAAAAAKGKARGGRP